MYAIIPHSQRKWSQQ